MKKKIIIRVISGLPIGLSIGYLISIAASFIWADGAYSPCVPELIDIAGSEINAVVLQAFLCAILGSGFGASSVIWEIEEWSLIKQTGIYFLIVSVLMMPIAYVTYWMEHSIFGFLSYFGLFALIFTVIWLIQYLRIKRNVGKLNEDLRRYMDDEGK